MRRGRKSLSQTPAPKKEQIYGSKKNPKGSASSEKSASKIVLSDAIISSLTKKLKDFKDKHPNNTKITLSDLKAVYRRGAGAYSSTHRPTITGGRPNTRNAWAMARVNKFLLKAGGTKVKKAYVQDDDLMKYADGGEVKSFYSWFCEWYKGVCDKMNIMISLPNEISGLKSIPQKEENAVILDLFEKIDQSTDAKPYLKKIIDKADEYGVTIYLLPEPRHKYIKDEAHKRKITRKYLIDYYSRFGFELIPNNEFMKRVPKYADGGTTDDHDETYKKWRKLVNMSYGELSKFYDSKEGKEAGLSSSEAKKQGISSGRESARWIMKMKTTPRDKWTPTMWKWANKQISFISRMSGNEGGLYDEKGNKTRKHTSLLIWGHNPKKGSGMKYSKGGLLAPNGKPSNLTAEQYKLVRTKAFKNWFGDWEKYPMFSSKVVDDNGEPLVVYHSTDEKFNQFDYKTINDSSNYYEIIGFYFTSNKPSKRSRYGNITKTCFLNIRDRILVTDPITEKNPYWETKKLNKKEILLLIGDKNPVYDDYSKEKTIEILLNIDKLNGQLEFLYRQFFSRWQVKDGIRLFLENLTDKLGFDGAYMPHSEYYVAFHPEQIKLADGSNTTFDGGNPDIRYEDGGMSDKPADVSKVISSSSRFRPSETIFFDPPLYGLNGNQLVSYTWSYEWTEDWNKIKGEPVAKRVSDWTQAELSAETGRNIVHKYTILKKDGTSVTVSSDSVPILLGYYEKAQTKQFGDLATASKTLAKQKLQLSILEAQNKEFQDAKNEIISKGYPEVVNMGEGKLGIRYTMGDSGVWDFNAKVSDPIDKERLEALQDGYVRSELSKMGIDTYRSTLGSKIYDLKNRIMRQERKVENILKSKMEDGGEMDVRMEDTVQRMDNPNFADISYYKRGGSLMTLTDAEAKAKVAMLSKKYKLPMDFLMAELEHGKKVESEHTDDTHIATKIAIDHLSENPNYYLKLKEMETELKQMPYDAYLQRVVHAYENGGEVDMIYSFQTPTGKPSKLNYIQQILVRTDAFKNWFGDWESCAKDYLKNNMDDFKKRFNNCSIVVDYETLEPQVVFHGTNYREEFYQFDVTKEQGVGRPYGYFADNREYSENFTTSSQRGQHGLYLLYNCFLNIRNPFFAINALYYGISDNYMGWGLKIAQTIYEDKYGALKREDADKFTKTLEVVMSQIGKYLFDALDNDFKNEKPFWIYMARDKNKEFKAFLMSHGYDGVRYAEEFKSVYDINDPAEFTKAWTIFDANQVKLADGRNIDFDPMNKDIRYEHGGNLSDMKNEKPTMYAEGGHVYGDGAKTNDGKRGGFFKGRSHATGGIKAVNVDTGQPLEVEGNEVIINKRSVQDSKKRMFEGKMMTNREILSKINQEGGGVAFEDGGEINESNCHCSGKKYKFGGETLTDYEIVKQLFYLKDEAMKPLDSSVNYVDRLIERMNIK